MPVTTLKRCQSDSDWWYTVEDCNVEVDEEPGSGLTIRYYDTIGVKEGSTVLWAKRMLCCSATQLTSFTRTPRSPHYNR